MNPAQDSQQQIALYATSLKIYTSSQIALANQTALQVILPIQRLEPVIIVLPIAIFAMMLIPVKLVKQDMIYLEEEYVSCR